MTIKRDPTILIVDDTEAALYAKSRALTRAGFRVIEAGTGTDALELAIANEPVLVLLDLMLPDMSGLEVCRRLKTRPDTEGILVAATSAVFTDSDDRVRGLENGADVYLVDPITPSELVATVQAMVRVWQREQEIRSLVAERDALVRVAERARQQAEAAARAKDEFLAIVSHELRNPLNAMIGWLRILSEPAGVTPETVAKAITVLNRNVEQQRQLIEDLLDTSRIVSGKLKLDLGRVDLMQVCQEAVEVVRSAAAARGVALEVAVGAPVSPIVGDAGRLRQIAWNLLSNAIKFTPAGGTVRLTVAQVGARVEIVVTDSGQGIAADFLPHVFELFQQYDSTSTRRTGGLGLGLALTKHLVELHGGEIRAESAGRDRGATFTVDLPLEAAFDPAGHTSTTPLPRSLGSEPVGPGQPSLRDVRVLAVDDEPETCELLTELLERAGAKPVTVTSGRAALALLDRDDEPRFDVLLCDIGMPDEDGYAVMRKVRALEAARGLAPTERIPAVALTAYTRPQDRIRALQNGFQMHLAKPVEPDELVVVIDSLLRGAGWITAGRTG
jgi:signal transduction histidine kinase